MPQKFKPQFRRLVALDRMLRKGGLVNCASLLRLPEFEGLHRRTVLRDIDYLRDELEAPVDYDPRKRSYVYTREGFFLPAVPLDEGDLFAVMLAEKVLEQYRQTPLFRRLKKTFEKIRPLLPERVRFPAAGLDARFSFFGPPSAPVRPAVWEAILSALSANRAVRIEHTTAGRDKPTLREVEPYHVICHEGAWYLVGLCRLKGEVRTFAFHRVSEAEALPDRFEMPRGFDIDAYMGEHFGIIRSEKEHKVRLRFSAAAAPYVLERDWHPTQRAKRRRDGAVDLSMRVNDLVEVLRWVLSWGSGVEVLGPKELRERVREEGRIVGRKNRGHR